MDIRSSKYPYNNSETGDLRAFIQAFHLHFLDQVPCSPSDLRLEPYSPEVLGNRSVSSFLLQYARCVVQDQECGDTNIAPPLNCCTQIDTSITNRFQNFLHLMPLELQFCSLNLFQNIQLMNTHYHLK